MAEIAGLKLIVPSSAVFGTGSGSISSSGKVSFTTANVVVVDGIFSSSYDNYLIVMSYLASTANTLRFRMRVGGATATAGDYNFQHLTASSTTVSGARTTSTTIPDIAEGETTESGCHIYLYGPYLTQPTALRSVSAGSESGAKIFDVAATHSLSTSYDGINIFASTGNITGALTVYGLSQ